MIVQADIAQPSGLGHEVPDLALVGDLQEEPRGYGRKAVESGRHRRPAAADEEPDDGRRRSVVLLVQAANAAVEANELAVNIRVLNDVSDE